MITIYPLEWIDSLILQTLDPKKTNIGDLSEKDLALITHNLSKESHKIQIQLKNEVFALHQKRQIRLLVQKYHASFVYLLDKVIEYQKNHLALTGVMAAIVDVVIDTLYELLSFIQCRYAHYLSLDERVPLRYLIVSREEILLRLQALKDKKMQITTAGTLIEIVFNAINNSIADKPERKITYREIFYQKELLKYLDALVDISDSSGFYSAMDQLLIEMNFNYPPYIMDFTDRIENHLSLQESLEGKINELVLYHKEFSQLLFNEKISFDPARENIRYVLENWFRHEIAYLERKIQILPETQRISEPDQNVRSDNKVECALSIDQMGLILRAGDEARILKARSLNCVFKTIVPYLSSSQKKDLSYNSMRSKSYTPEDRDKEIAIKTLKRIIKHIEEF
ncbi:hypothetical protein FLA105534_01533 [Flavobacterium bizetiae]|uniref:Uncharacterized protein n=1 Tax=Flavobacterium bizetiae TaxID=2704140 RepID=A0A6J4GGW3_9FLAO|nr:hypothetical protein [Flavobacterium bizetiae]CAA9197237.1 hypothetical protein FLA105534_01533 [Flavobacterium bizetiae]CAD5342607.1 hypothetical protein FLA105535_02595 [Flavobacterium bizetiae]CAD5348142.1 hypothetical protein FLA105534_02101 [Flavobacterium bizetiae]